MASARSEVVVCGGGIAGVEALLRLHRLAPGGPRVTLIEPQEEFVYRPLAVLEPFSGRGARRYPLERIVADTAATWKRDRVVRVDSDRRRVHTQGGLELGFDALLLAVGARESAPYEHTHVFTDRNADDTYHGIVQDIELGYVRRIAFLAPQGQAWPLPLYELALMTAERADSMNVQARITFITPERFPLQSFGQAVGEAVARLLADAGIELVTATVPRVPEPRQVEIDGRRLEAQWIITLPRITGPAVTGVPTTGDGFVAIDDHCLVPGTDGAVFAVGDATDFPVKHGGVGAQQADTAAAEIAWRAGLADRPPPFAPVMRGMLLTGRRPLYISAQLIAGRGWESQIHEQPPWPASQKVIAEELPGYLSRIDPAFAG